MNLEKELIKLRDKKRAEGAKRFFKMEKGQYGQGDKFLGITMPVLRSVCKEYFKNNNEDVGFAEIQKLLKSQWHEVRMAGLLLLTKKEKHRSDLCKMMEFYLKNTKYINNWDLVDVSVEHIVGKYLLSLKPAQRIKFLSPLINSKDLWERRIAIVSTFAIIKQGDYTTTFIVAEKLLEDKEDLIHKATGWMLRECGKKCDKQKLEEFLEKNIHKLPRTTLRYAIEHFSDKKRKYFLGL